MKRIFLILILLMSVSFAQNTDKESTDKSELAYWYDLFESTLEALRVRMIQDTGDTLLVKSVFQTLTADSLFIKSNSSDTLWSVSVTTTPQQLLNYSCNEFDLINENSSGNILYSNASGGVYRKLFPETQHSKKLNNTNRYYVKTESGTLTLKVEARK